MSTSDPIERLVALRPKLEALAADAQHGAVDRELMGLVDQLHSTWLAATRRADVMERIDALNTMRQELALASGAAEAARSLLPAVEARTLRVRLDASS